MNNVISVYFVLWFIFGIIFSMNHLNTKNVRFVRYQPITYKDILGSILFGFGISLVWPIALIILIFG